ncbi:MAG: hypothetical protein NTZ37_02690 [Methanoregula sp.]|nr:hypothetical protein [Methanoregula sp.]
MAIILALIMAGVMIAGCTQNPAPAATPVPTPLATPTATPAATVPVPQPSFSLGDHYLQKSYSFQSEKDVFVEQIRVDNPSWGIGFDVLPLNDDQQYCWFEMNITNMDTQQFDIYGYGRDKGFEKHQLYPMYTTGPYKIEMKGNLVKVDVTVAKRNP